MADLKISQLTNGNPAQTNDEIPVARSGANFKITAGSISALPPTTAGANQVIYVDSAGTSLDGDPNFVYTATGNVGINTASPGARLQVSQNPSTAIGILQTGASTNTSLTFDTASLGLQNTNTTNNNYNTLAFINDQGTYSVGLHGIYTSHTAGAQSGAFAIATRNAGTYAERMRIDSAGNVVIGATSGTFRLQVETDTNGNAGAFVRNNNTGASASGTFSVASAVGNLTLRAHSAAHSVWPNQAIVVSDSTFTNGLALVTSGATPLSFWTNSSERARITSTGELLVGTTTNTNSSRLVASGTISETVSSVQYLVASQFDVGTAPNQIPLNQYLGTMAFQDSTAVSVGQLRANTSSGIGYSTGAGGTVTQGTSRTTGVTINTICGSITLFSAAGSTAWQSFTVTNSAVAATDTIIVNQRSGTDLNMIHVTNVAAGSFRISFATTGGTTVEQPVFNFAVIKAVTA